jgi:hypothetical protein
MATRERKRANQKQTEAGQKMNAPAVDLGCAAKKLHSPMNNIFIKLFARF